MWWPFLSLLASNFSLIAFWLGFNICSCNILCNSLLIRSSSFYDFEAILLWHCTYNQIKQEQAMPMHPVASSNGMSLLSCPSNKGETRQTWAMTALVVTKGVEWSKADGREGRREGRKISCECSLGCVVQSKVRCNFPQYFS